MFGKKQFFFFGAKSNSEGAGTRLSPNQKTLSTAWVRKSLAIGSFLVLSVVTQCNDPNANCPDPNVPCNTIVTDDIVNG